MKYEIEYYYISHVGKCRKMNQDNFFCAGRFMEYENSGTGEIQKGKIQPSETSIFAVFDGMGGEESGEMAAYFAAKTLAERTLGKRIEQELISFCKDANLKICSYAEENEISSMGTTAAILSFSKKKIGLCNIGDSKIFYFSNHELQQISQDHVSVSAFGTKPPLTQNLGIPETELLIAPYVATGEYQDGDIFLICSDGLTDMMQTEEIKELLQSQERMTAAKQLLERALENGGRDNITFILLYVDKKKIFKK